MKQPLAAKRKSEVQKKKQRVIALAGNPNVGKSTLFNQLTGLHQHTGNWAGKTVAHAKGVAEYNERSYLLVDLPGTYSLFAHSGEEEVARDFICFGAPDAVLLVCDATCLARNLNLVLQTLEITRRVVVCVNLLDEAKRKGIVLDLEKLSLVLGVPVVGCTAKKKKTLLPLFDALEKVIETPPKEVFLPKYPQKVEDGIEKIEQMLRDFPLPVPSRWLALRLLEGETDLLRTAKFYSGGALQSPLLQKAVQKQKEEYREEKTADIIPTTLVQTARDISQSVTAKKGDRNFDRQLDKLFTGKKTAFPLMLLFLVLLFWITIWGANDISSFLSRCFGSLEEMLVTGMDWLSPPRWLRGILIEGIYRVLSWVVAVMLPPMMIFFPLFTLLEDMGYLPRIAYNLDKPFDKAGTCGKQALTMCMGIGCNAVGVMGCRIMDAKREKLAAILTNCFMPCNGRFPLLIALISLFFAWGKEGSLLSALLLLLGVALATGLTFGVTKLLSVTLLKGMPASFTLELPPYRKPKVFEVLVRSLLDRTSLALGRAVIVAIPAGAVIWLLANLHIGDSTVLKWISLFLEPFGKAMGMDGMILLAFLLAFPANEILLPVLLMGYLTEGQLVEITQTDVLKNILTANGWTWRTALCTSLFSLFHFPCSTTLLTIKKETGSWKWTVLAFLLPTVCGVLCCLVANWVTMWF